MLHDLRYNLCSNLLVEGLFRHNAHFIITLFSFGSHHERYNEVVYNRHQSIIKLMIIAFNCGV